MHLVRVNVSRCNLNTTICIGSIISGDKVDSPFIHLNTTICIGSMLLKLKKRKLWELYLNTTICIGSIVNLPNRIPRQIYLNTTICIGSMRVLRKLVQM